jgi:hypothetical protein
MTATNLQTGCQYLGTGTEPCGALTLEGSSYCAEHHSLIYQKGTARRRRHKEIRTVDQVRIIEQLMNEAVAELEAEGFDVYGERELVID